MIFFNDAMIIPWLIGPMFYGFFVDVCGLIQLYFDGNSVVSRDNEEISMLYLYILVVKFTTTKFKVYTHLSCFTIHK